MRIVVLGGAGAMAQVINHDLASSRGVQDVVVADRDLKKAKAAAAAIGTAKMEAASVDVTNASAVGKLVADADAVVNATWYQFNIQVMTACIKAGVHYLDLGGLFHTTRKQLKLDAAARKAGVTCLLGMGSTPGTMNLMAAHAANGLDKVKSVTMRSAGVLQGKPQFQGFFSPYSFRTVLDEFSLPVPVLRKGKLVTLDPLSASVAFQMPKPVGRAEGFLTIHSELATLPESIGKGVQEMDFAVGFDAEFSGILTHLHKLGLTSRKGVSFGGKTVIPHEVVATIVDQLPRPRHEPPDIDIQTCELIGTREGRTTRIIVDCISRPRARWGVGGGTVGTGTPPSIAAQWLANGAITARGALPPERAIDPAPFLQALSENRRTIVVSERVGQGRRHAIRGSK